MNEDQPVEQTPVESVPDEQPPAEAQRDAAPGSEPPRNEPPPQDPRRRLRELLAIPDHQRTDAIWDEIIELEICLAPGNRIQPGSSAEPGRRQGQPQGQGRRPEQPRRQDPMPGAKPAKRFFKKAKRPQGGPPKP